MSFKELEEHMKTHQIKSKSTNLHLTCGKYIKFFFLSYSILLLVAAFKTRGYKVQLHFRLQIA